MNSVLRINVLQIFGYIEEGVEGLVIYPLTRILLDVSIYPSVLCIPSF